jgi:hypothetical protein
MKWPLPPVKMKKFEFFSFSGAIKNNTVEKKMTATIHPKNMR